MPNSATSPPEVTERLEGGEGALAYFDRFAQPASKKVDLCQAGFGKGLYFIQAGVRSEPYCLVAIADRDVGLAAGQDMQKSAPVMPGRTAARVVALVDEIAYLIEGLDVLGMLAEREFDLGLFDHGVDTAQPVRSGFGQQVKSVQRVIEVSQRLGVGPAALRFLSGQDRVIDRLLRLVVAARRWFRVRSTRLRKRSG